MVNTAVAIAAVARERRREENRGRKRRRGRMIRPSVDTYTDLAILGGVVCFLGGSDLDGGWRFLCPPGLQARISFIKMRMFRSKIILTVWLKSVTNFSVLWVIGQEAKAACGTEQLVGGVEAGIEGGIHAMRLL